MQYDEFKKTLENYLEECETKLELWKNVKRLSKKDGSDFQNFGKNFEGAKVDRSAYSDTEELNVHGRTKSGRWIEDTILVFGRNYQHPLTVSGAFEKIELRIKYYEVKIRNCKLQIAHAERIYNLTVNTVKALYDEALKEIQEAGYTPTFEIDTPSIMYQIHHVLEQSFPPHIKCDKDQVIYRP